MASVVAYTNNDNKATGIGPIRKLLIMDDKFMWDSNRNCLTHSSVVSCILIFHYTSKLNEQRPAVKRHSNVLVGSENASYLTILTESFKNRAVVVGDRGFYPCKKWLDPPMK